MSYLDDTGLAYFWTKIKAYVSSFLTWANIQNKPSTFAPSAHSHGNITNAGELGTASRAVVTDGNKKVSVSSVTSTELGYLSGVTSSVQTQLNGKAAASDIPAIPSLSRTISGSGNAVTDITVSGHAITATKGTTFLTSHQDISGKVNKSGDTMTGTLYGTSVIINGIFAKKNEQVTKGTAPGSTQYWTLNFADKNGTNFTNNVLAQLESRIDADNKVYCYMRALKNTAATNTNTELGVVYDTNNSTGWAYGPHPAADANDTRIATTKWVKDRGYLTSHQTLPTLSKTDSGSGNAVTAISVSGHAITVTKGSTFLTSHQSLANYVTLNSAQTISAVKTFTASPKIKNEFSIYDTILDYRYTPTTSSFFNIYWLDKNNKSIGRILGYDNTSGDRAFNFGAAPRQSEHAMWDLFTIGLDSSNNVYAFFNSHCTRVAPNGAGCTLGQNSTTRRWGQIYSSSTSISTSDERVKTEIQEVPDAVLDCWEGISWLQFKMKDSVSVKGDAARVHNGAIAQRILEAFSAAGLDASRYGLFCYDEWDFEADLTDDEGNVIREGQEGGDLYSLRYEEALCMEAAYQRRENARLKKRIADLEERLAALELKVS